MNRRHFLKLGGLFTAAAVVAPAAILKALAAIPPSHYGFLAPDDKTEEALRKMLDLPPRNYDFEDKELWDLVAASDYHPDGSFKQLRVVA